MTPAKQSPTLASGVGVVLVAIALLASQAAALVPYPAPGSDDDTIHVVFGCDDRFVVGLTAAFVSLVEHTPLDRALSVWVFDGGFTAESRERIVSDFHVVATRVAQKVNAFSGRVPVVAAPRTIEIVTVDPEAVPQGSLWRGSTATYLRLFIPSHVPADVSKVIYLDSDILVTDDISVLWGFDLGGHPVAAVQDISAPYGEGDYLDSQFGRHPLSDYFNAGVMVVNVTTWREEGLDVALIDFANSHTGLKYHDQDALNILLEGRWQPLPLSWNVVTLSAPPFYLAQRFGKELLPFADDLNTYPSIVHFIGPATIPPPAVTAFGGGGAYIGKPWHYLSSHPKRAEFFAALDLAPSWTGWRPTAEHIPAEAYGYIKYFVAKVKEDFGDDFDEDQFWDEFREGVRAQVAALAADQDGVCEGEAAECGGVPGSVREAEITSTTKWER